MRKKDIKILISLITFLIAAGVYAWNYFVNGPIKEQPRVEGTFKVTKVIDGDTIELETGQTLRYIGIDTPETVKPNTPVECFGKAASDKNKELVEGKYVRLEKDVNETDRYGRLLRYVYLDDKFINKILVEEGYASAVSFPPDIKYQDILKEAEQTAREKNLGLWGTCEKENTPDATISENTKNINVGPCVDKADSEEKSYYTFSFSTSNDSEIKPNNDVAGKCTIKIETKDALLTLGIITETPEFSFKKETDVPESTRVESQFLKISPNEFFKESGLARLKFNPTKKVTITKYEYVSYFSKGEETCTSFIEKEGETALACGIKGIHLDEPLIFLEAVCESKTKEEFDGSYCDEIMSSLNIKKL